MAINRSSLNIDLFYEQLNSAKIRTKTKPKRINNINHSNSLINITDLPHSSLSQLPKIIMNS